MTIVSWKSSATGIMMTRIAKTEVVMTANLREWRHFFKLRTAPAAHPQMREVAIPLLHQMRSQVPVIFDDIEEAAHETL